MKRIFSLLGVAFITIALLAQEQKQEEFVFKGEVKEFEDSGLGPFYQLTLLNESKNDTLSSLILIDLIPEGEMESLIGKTVKISYGFQYENWLHSIEAKPEKEIAKHPEDSKYIRAIGRLNTCTCGDMGGYLDIKLPDGQEMSFMTEFFCPEDLFKGDDVIVYYIVAKETEIYSIEIIDK